MFTESFSLSYTQNMKNPLGFITDRKIFKQTKWGIRYLGAKSKQISQTLHGSLENMIINSSFSQLYLPL